MNTTVPASEHGVHAVHYRQTAGEAPGISSETSLDVILDALGMSPGDVVLFWALSILVATVGGVAVGVIL